MPAFQGSLKLIGDTSTLRARVDIDAGRVVVTANGHELGTWDLAELEVQQAADGFHIWVEDEELLFVTGRPEELADTLGVRSPGESSIQPWEPSIKNSEPDRTPTAPRARRWSLHALGRRLLELPPKHKRLGAAAIGLLLLGVFARDVLVLGLVVAASAVTLVGGIALADPIIQARLPGRWPPMYWIIAGLAVLAAALTLDLVM